MNKKQSVEIISAQFSKMHVEVQLCFAMLNFL